MPLRSTLMMAACVLLTFDFGDTASHPALASDTASVSVDFQRTVATVPSSAVGVNTAVWDHYLDDKIVPKLLRQAGAEMLRYPGGSTSDVYHWQTHSITATDASQVAPGASFDRFVKRDVQPARAHVIITVNYGSNRKGNAGGDPKEAAGWVRYANRVHHEGIKYWEIGNEIYGNGYYGAKWETDLHRDHSPAAYARNALTFSRLMKAQDRSIKIGLVVTAPGNWPDGQGPMDWNSTVLSRACQGADFVAVHWYPQLPGKETDAGLLSSVSAVPDMVSKLRSEITQYCGAWAPNIQIMLTETNSVSSNPGKQTTSVVNGLFLIEDYLSWLQAGIQNVSWWDLHNGSDFGNDSDSLLGPNDYGDYGLLSVGGTHEPPPDTTMPTYTALRVLTRALTKGSAFAQATSSESGIRAFALKQADGTLAVVLINTDAHAQYTVPLTINNFGPVTSASATIFGAGSNRSSTVALTPENGTVAYFAAPYSAAIIHLSTAGKPMVR